MKDRVTSGTHVIANMLFQANEMKRKNDYQGSLTLYLQVVEQTGETVEALAAVANCYFSLALHNPYEQGENYDKAIAWMERAIALSPDNARLHAALAQFYELGTLDYEQAAKEYRKAIALNPNDVWALVGATSLYGVPEEVVTLDEAINWLERATQLEPDDPNYHHRLGDLYDKAGRTADAEREWLRALLCPRPLDPGPARTVKIALGTDSE